MNKVNIKREAGTLLHISSLPGEFGIGDFGPSAKKFIRFLQRSGQKYWQVLPLNVTNGSTSHSPYSSLSAFAGNTLFIDPYELVKEGLLDKKALHKNRVSSSSVIDYKESEVRKSSLFRQAFRNFTKETSSPLHEKYNEFILKESLWLNDFALFTVLKDHYGGNPWNEWSEEFRDRDNKALMHFKGAHQEEYDYTCFLQFLFDLQWKKIKTLANESEIKIYGDIPIYVSYDSSDVWANPELFDLHEDKSMAVVAGVPPDYFNEDGQRWGMPLFKWDQMKENHYEWWVSRLKRNLGWFDLLRLDHFRGFASYWEIPAASETAKDGVWMEGPGASLFHEIKLNFPDMPFVAEDLGMIDQAVYDLRDQFDLPGMRVLQFGFSENMEENIHAPINYSKNSIAYTGTHDNNTVKGWFMNETDLHTKERIASLTSKNVTEKNVSREMIKLVLASDSSVAIIPMQDWLGLGEGSRMNKPSTTDGNWSWKIYRKYSLNIFRSAGIKSTIRNSGR